MYSQSAYESEPLDGAVGLYSEDVNIGTCKQLHLNAFKEAERAYSYRFRVKPPDT